MNKVQMATGVVLTGGALMLSGCASWFDRQGADTRNVPPGNAATSQAIIETNRHNPPTVMGYRSLY